MKCDECRSWIEEPNDRVNDCLCWDCFEDLELTLCPYCCDHGLEDGTRCMERWSGENE